VLSIDHLVIAVADLETAARRYRAEYGIPFASGGIHPGGTANSANLFPDGSYIELLEVHDASLPFAAVVRRFLDRHRDGLFHWALRRDDIETVAARTGITPTVGWIDSIEGDRQASWRTVSHPGRPTTPLPGPTGWENLRRMRDLQRSGLSIGD
jgi:hypothetical protein